MRCYVDTCAVRKSNLGNDISEVRLSTVHQDLISWLESEQCGNVQGRDQRMDLTEQILNTFVCREQCAMTLIDDDGSIETVRIQAAYAAPDL